jgi:hypothetical protein
MSTMKRILSQTLIDIKDFGKNFRYLKGICIQVFRKFRINESFRRIIHNFFKDVINKSFLLRIIGKNILKHEVDEIF